MKKVLLLFSAIIVVIVAFFSCHSGQRFNADIWKEKGLDWWMSAKREKMVDDLIKSDTLIGMNKKQVIELLGKPEMTDKTNIKYLIREKYSSDIDPDYVSYLIVEFDNTGHVKQYKTVRYGTNE